MTNHVHIYPDLQQLARQVAGDLAALCPAGHATKNPCCVALSGGNTPKLLLGALAQHYKNQVAWERLHVFWGDERCVAPDAEQSNYAAAKEALLDHVPLPPTNVHRMPGDMAPAAGAAAYERTLQHHFKLAPDEVPNFDLILLGMGADGHTASLFAGHTALREQERLVVEVHEPKVAPPWRLSMTMPVIIGAKRVWFLVTGAEKQPLVRTILKNPDAVADKYPAARAYISVRNPAWYLDQAAYGA